jgi:hypothetical protein
MDAGVAAEVGDPYAAAIGRPAAGGVGGPAASREGGQAAADPGGRTGLALGGLCFTGVGGVTGPRSQGRSLCFRRRLSTGPRGPSARICPVAAEARGVPARDHWFPLDINRSSSRNCDARYRGYILFCRQGSGFDTPATSRSPAMTSTSCTLAGPSLAGVHLAVSTSRCFLQIPPFPPKLRF